MTRVKLNITTEGDTELKFVKDTLAKYLSGYGIDASPRNVSTSREFRGGMTTYDRAKRDIQNWLKQNSSSEWRFTTMFDLYRLPKDFPRYKEALKMNDPYEKVRLIEEAFKQDIGDYRFFPYIQLHEFEALIFVDPGILSLEFPEKKEAIRNLVKLSNEIDPELINGNPGFAPSKRIIKEIKRYENTKATVGPIIVDLIGIPRLKEKCRHFSEWISKLEGLAVSV